MSFLVKSKFSLNDNTLSWFLIEPLTVKLSDIVTSDVLWPIVTAIPDVSVAILRAQ